MIEERNQQIQKVGNDLYRIFYKIQQKKMKELWDNKLDEEWEDA